MVPGRAFARTPHAKFAKDRKPREESECIGGQRRSGQSERVLLRRG